MRYSLVLSAFLFLVAATCLPALCAPRSGDNDSQFALLRPSESPALSHVSEASESQPDANSLPNPDPEPQVEAPVKSSPRVGVGVIAGSVGIGGDIAVRIIHSANVRFGFSGLGISRDFSQDGVSYGARFRPEAAQLTFDWFFYRGIHLSPGLLIYNGMRVTGTALAPAGTTFTLNSVTYESSSANPLTGSVAVTFRKTAPMVLLGFGNLVPRGRRHWSVTFDMGAAFSGSPRTALSFTGFACKPPNTSGPTCLNVATDPTVQANIVGEQASVNDKLKFFKFYPMIQLGFGYSF